MRGHLERESSFILQSLCNLKNESGGQRWNSISEDIVKLYKVKFSGGGPYTDQEIWTLFFEPNQIKGERLQYFKKNLENTEFSDFMFLGLRACLDPPVEWWDKQLS